ncbi:uncharacterized protein EDB93DRAFT_1143854 [Suillus bovinus]|uniref:uncharacterized protein n=1 Tax=Suillus bovinus TaxID=48563 RepID=UPI001B876509|nr:uncharacterized protein EDB93DRAFT_1143854 [Suillus bovinus]KAG2149125.1 hypothetical protein EDB93DRAFT_1143854 [Suillus bovinus]
MLKDNFSPHIDSRKLVRSDISCSVTLKSLEDKLSKSKQSEIVSRRLKALIKRREFLITPAAVATLCDLCKISWSTLLIPVINADAFLNMAEFLETTMKSGILATLIDLLEFDKQGLSGGPRGLMQLANFEKLIFVSDELRQKIIERGGLVSIVGKLAKLDHALFAADALLNLMQHDDAKEQILDSKVDLHLLQMIEKRIFDGTIGREGMDILKDIFENDDLRGIMLVPKNEASPFDAFWNLGGKDTPQWRFRNAANCALEKTAYRVVTKQDFSKYRRNVIWILRKMIENESTSVQNSAINYLRTIVEHEDAYQQMIEAEIVKPLLSCLEATGVGQSGSQITYCDANMLIHSSESLRNEIVKNVDILATMLSSQYPVEVNRVTATLIALSSHGEIREKVQETVGMLNSKMSSSMST